MFVKLFGVQVQAQFSKQGFVVYVDRYAVGGAQMMNCSGQGCRAASLSVS